MGQSGQAGAQGLNRFVAVRDAVALRQELRMVVRCDVINGTRPKCKAFPP
jgi:hypothetical protein